MTDRLYQEMRRYFYTTPSSYLDLLKLYMLLLDKKQQQIIRARDRISCGLSVSEINWNLTSCLVVGGCTVINRVVETQNRGYKPSTLVCNRLEHALLRIHCRFRGVRFSIIKYLRGDWDLEQATVTVALATLIWSMLTGKLDRANTFNAFPMMVPSMNFIFSLHVLS